MTELKSKAWRSDRNWLREQLRGKPEGLYATFLNVLVSHMRGKLHMTTYRLKAGGWCNSNTRYVSRVTIPEKRKPFVLKAYGTDAQYYYARSAILDLRDQEAWIRHFLSWYRNDDVYELTCRVLNASVAYAVEEETTPEVQEAPAAQTA